MASVPNPSTGGSATAEKIPEFGQVSKYVKVSDDLTIHCEVSGEGDIALIFVPGWTMTTRVFEHQLAHFAGCKRFRAITYDPRGQGLSTKTAEGHYYEQHGRDLHNFIEKLGLQRIILVGWSNGGFDALAYLNQFGSGKLVGLVMLDTTPKGRGTDLTKEWVWYGTKDEGDQDGIFKLQSYDVLIDRQAANVAFAEWLLENPSAENVKFLFDQTNQTSDAVTALLTTSGWFLDYSKDLKALNNKVPLLYVVREEWKDLGTAWASANTPAAEVVAFGKHMMFWERHEQFNAVLDQFLEAVAGK